jgi:large subunit ribosomal protein L28
MHPSLTRLAQSAAAVSGLPFKRAQLGLFHGQTRSSGNNVPHSKQKTRRTWLPNIQNKHLVSEILGRKIEIKVTVKALKTMRKVCGSVDYVRLVNNIILRICSTVVWTSTFSRQSRTCSVLKE